MSKKPGANEWPEELTIDELMAKIKAKYLRNKQLIDDKEIEQLTNCIATSLDNEALALLLTDENFNKLEELLISTYLKNKNKNGNKQAARNIFINLGIPCFRKAFFTVMKRRFSKFKTGKQPTFQCGYDVMPAPIPPQLISDLRTKILSATTEGEIS